MSNQIARASAADIHEIITAIEPVLSGYPRNNVLMACISIAFMCMKPDLSLAHLQRGVMETSVSMQQFLQAIVADESLKELLDFEVPPDQMN